MTKEQYEKRYTEIEAAAEAGIMTWKTALALVAMLSIEFAHSQHPSVRDGVTR